MARRQRSPQDEELRTLGVRILDTLSGYEAPQGQAPLLALLQRNFDGSLVVRRSPALTDTQRTTVHDMALSAIRNDRRLPPFTEWQEGHLPTTWVYGISAERIEQWREAGRTRQKA